MRRAQYRIDGPGGPAECVVFYFGPGQGGDARANVARWISQFRRADGKPIGDSAKTREIKVGDIPITLVEVGGHVRRRNGPRGRRSRAPELHAVRRRRQGARRQLVLPRHRPARDARAGAFDKLVRSIKPGNVAALDHWQGAAILRRQCAKACSAHASRAGDTEGAAAALRSFTK